MNIGVAYSDKFKQLWIKLEVPDRSTVREIIEHSGMLRKFPEINLDRQQVGVFGKIVRLDSVVAEGDRVEIYREITADPELVERRDE
ncbi:MAG: RnfH family protein [Chromatiaceae bacterium]|nr:RnfH family protein [Gammaproteobacteria bacterium]MCB1880111.1 RnfH family protein [Gammaproteobacteria bacterium]MCP5448334.1 RnfH family protein [Chromatiaceae bacterium]